MRWTRISALTATAALSVAAAACGSSTPSANAGNTTGNATTTTPPSATTTVPATTGTTLPPVSMPTAAGTFGTAPPTITVPTGPPPTVLESSDLITGTGATAKTGDNVTMQYVLVDYATGQQIQSSWTSQSFQFTVGEANIIKGWNEGVPGMKVGGRRELVIPPALAYGATPPAGAGIAANATLVFVIDLLKVG
jgi:peptidylprolyl isomerase